MTVMNRHTPAAYNLLKRFVLNMLQILLTVHQKTTPLWSVASAIVALHYHNICILRWAHLSKRKRQLQCAV